MVEKIQGGLSQLLASRVVGQGKQTDAARSRLIVVLKPRVAVSLHYREKSESHGHQILMNVRTHVGKKLTKLKPSS